MSMEPICSATLRVPLPLLGEASDAVRKFFDTFKVRATMYPSSAVWNLEMLMSNGMAAAQLHAASLPEDDEDLEDRDRDGLARDDSYLFRDDFDDNKDDDDDDDDDDLDETDLARARLDRDFYKD